MSSFFKSLIRHMKSKSRKTKKITPEVQRLAKISDISYKKSIKERRKLAKDLGLDIKKQGKTYTVLEDQQTGKIYLSLRGTDIQDINDLQTDLHIASNLTKYSKRYKN